MRKIKLIRVLMPLAAVVLALLVGAVLIAMVGVNPLKAYGILFSGAFGDLRSITDSMVKAIPLVFTGLAFAFAAKCNVYNIGAEGQLYVGALAAMAAGIYLPAMPPVLHVVVSLLCGALAGGIWAGIAAALKVRLGINEVINTIMLNYIGKLFVSFMVYGPMIEGAGKSPQTLPVQESAELPALFRGTKLHTGIFLAVLASVAVYLIFKHTTFGYHIKAVGFNKEASRFAGIKVNRYIFLALFISGVLAGLAGSVEMLGVNKRLIVGFSPNYGSDGIVVSLLGQSHPFGILLASFLMGALRVGANSMQRAAFVPAQVISIIQGIVVLFVIASGAFVHVWEMRAQKKEVKALA